jgi:hypothetical protein
MPLGKRGLGHDLVGSEAIEVDMYYVGRTTESRQAVSVGHFVSKVHGSPVLASDYYLANRFVFTIGLCRHSIKCSAELVGIQ